MTLSRAIVALLVALLLAVAAAAHWLDRRGAKRLRVAAAELRNETVSLRSGIIELREEIASLRSGKGVSLQPTSIELSPADTYERLDHNWKSNADTSERAVVPCNDGGPLRAMVVVTLGQSNAANQGQGLYTPKHHVDNFNLYDGKCYKAVEPLLGPSGQGGNFATRLADMLIERRLADPVIVAPIAMGGTTVEQWAHEGAIQSADHGLDSEALRCRSLSGLHSMAPGRRQHRRRRCEWTAVSQEPARSRCELPSL